MPRPQRTPRWLWAGRIAAGAILVGLTGYLAHAGLDDADKLASSIGVVIAVTALLAPYLLPAPGDVTQEHHEHHHYPGKPGPFWPVRVGQVPLLASAFQARPGLRQRVEQARGATGGVPSNSVILTQTSTSASAQVLSGGGGVGKSQLAASYAHEALDGGTDLVVWADASTAGVLVTDYAKAAVRVQAPGASGNPDDAEADARAFLDWLSTTHQS